MASTRRSLLFSRCVPGYISTWQRLRPNKTMQNESHFAGVGRRNLYVFCQYFTWVAIKMWSSAPRGIPKYINSGIQHCVRREWLVSPAPPVPPLSKNICIEYWNRIPARRSLLSFSRALTLWYILNSHS